MSAIKRPESENRLTRLLSSDTPLLPQPNAIPNDHPVDDLAADETSLHENGFVTVCRTKHLYHCYAQFRLKHMADLRELDWLHQKAANPLTDDELREVLAGSIPNRDHRNKGTDRLNQEQRFKCIHLRPPLG
jgi:hypothetical protein